MRTVNLKRYWRCCDQQCNSTAVTENNDLIKEANAHNHEMPTRDINTAKLKAKLKATVRVQHVGIKQTYDSAMRELTMDVPAENLPGVLAEQPEYDTDREVRLWVRRIMAMALAPLETFAFLPNGANPPIWQELVGNVPAVLTVEMKNALFQYVWQTWCNPENALFILLYGHISIPLMFAL